MAHASNDSWLRSSGSAGGEGAGISGDAGADTENVPPQEEDGLVGWGGNEAWGVQKSICDSAFSLERSLKCLTAGTAGC